MTLLFAMPEVVAGILTFLVSVAGPVASVVAAVVYAVKRERKKALAKVESEPPAAPMPLPAPPGTPFGHEVTGRLMDALEKRTEWLVSELKEQLKQCETERSELSADLQRTATALMIAERDKLSAKAKVATLEQSLAHWQSEAARHEAEAERYRARLRKERVDPEAIATPLRPPRR